MSQIQVYTLVTAAETAFEVSLFCQDQLSRSGPRLPCSMTLNPGFYPVCELQSTKDTEALFDLNRVFAGARNVSGAFCMDSLDRGQIPTHFW